MIDLWMGGQVIKQAGQRGRCRVTGDRLLVSYAGTLRAHLHTLTRWDYLPPRHDNEASITDEILFLLPCWLWVVIVVAEDPVEYVGNRGLVLDVTKVKIIMGPSCVKLSVTGKTYLYALLYQASHESLEPLILPTAQGCLEYGEKPNDALERLHISCLGFFLLCSCF